MPDASPRVDLVPMMEAHIPAILRIERRVFPSPWTAGMFEQEVGNTAFSRAMVALEGDVVVGYIVPWFLQDEVHLLNVAVSPEHQRRGHGRAMMDWLIAAATRERAGLITLEVRHANQAARRLYDRLGFKPVGLRKNYYAETGEDAVVMILDLRERPEGGG